MKKTVLSAFLIFAAAYSAFSSANTRKLNLLIRDSATNFSDQTAIYFDPGAIVTYRFPEDVQKTMDSVQALPQIYSYTSDNVSCYSNGYGNFNNTVVIPLGLRVLTSTYTISAYAINNFDPATFIYLEDRLLGTITDLRATSYAIYVTQPGFINNRFFIHFTYPPVVTTTDAGCANNDGSVIVTQDTSVKWTSCTLYDSSGTTQLQNVNNATGNLTFAGLAEGAYRVEFVFNGAVFTRDVTVAGHKIIAGINASVIYANVNQQINFDAVATHSNQFTWDFGDSTFITGIAHPVYAYSEPGTYNVTLKCTNTFGCVGYGYTTIYVSSATGINELSSDQVNIVSEYKDIRINVSNFAGKDYQYELYDISGKLMSNGHVTSSDFLVTLNGRSTGIYIVSVKDSDGAGISKKVFLSE
ncbi:MAG: hypothetical protein JWO06_3531 [Bacteroidota bacterium]|nr:hypothetical protein [Bacteroidota bacterium]